MLVLGRVALLLLLVAACDGEASVRPDAGGGGDGAGGGEVSPCASGEAPTADGGCRAAGLPAEMPACPPGEGEAEDGACVAAGVPPDACAPGFVTDRDGGCEPVLPETCPPGLMALPGESTCREVAPCAPGTWGDIPVDATTEHVDASYGGGDSDGSALKPWTTLADGLAAAQGGAIVALAAGSYTGVIVATKPARIWGRCPAMVEIVATAASSDAALAVGPAAGGTEVRDVALTGGTWGVALGYGKDVLVDRVWFHGLETGADVRGGAASLVVSRSLFEGMTISAVFTEKAEITLEDSVVRGTVDGYALWLTAASTAKVIGSVLEDNSYLAMYVESSDLDVDSSVVRRTVPADGLAGRALHVLRASADAPRPNVAVRRSVFVHNRETAVSLAAADVLLEDSTVSDTESAVPGGLGVGLLVAEDPDTAEPGALTVRRSLVARSYAIGVAVRGGAVTLERARVSGVEANDDTDATSALDLEGAVAQATATVRESILEGSEDIGVFVNGAELLLEATVVRDNGPAEGEPRGRGVDIQHHPTTGRRPSATIRTSLIDHNRKSGVRLMGGDLLVEATVIRDTLATPDKPYSHGLSVQNVPDTQERSVATVRSSVIESNVKAGLIAWGSDVVIESTLIRGTTVDPVSQYASSLTVLDNDGLRGNLTVRWSAFEDNQYASIVVIGSDAVFDDTRISRTLPTAEGVFGRAVQIQYNAAGGSVANVALARCLIEDAVETGLMAVGSEVTLDSCTVRGVRANAFAVAGDGVSIASEAALGAMTLTGSTIEGSARAGISTFGGKLTLGTTRLECNAIDIAAEPYLEFTPAFDDLGANACGCAGAELDCAAETAGLAPPPPVSPEQEPGED